MHLYFLMYAYLCSDVLACLFILLVNIGIHMYVICVSKLEKHTCIFTLNSNKCTSTNKNILLLDSKEIVS